MSLRINNKIGKYVRRYGYMSRVAVMVFLVMGSLVFAKTVNTQLNAAQDSLVLGDTSSVIDIITDKSQFTIPISEGKAQKADVKIFAEDKTTAIGSNVNIKCNKITDKEIVCEAPQKNQIDTSLPFGTSYWLEITVTSVNKNDNPIIIWKHVTNGATTQTEPTDPTNPSDPIGQDPVVITPPAVNYQFTNSATVFHNRNANIKQEDGEELLAGWKMNLYRESTPGSAWEFVAPATSSAAGRVGFGAIKGSGTYHICLVNQLGWTQTPQDWSGTIQHVITPNDSPNKANEGAYCTSADFPNAGNKSAVSNIGVRYNDQTNTNQLNLGGYAFDNMTTNRMEYKNQPVLHDWTFRLYEEKNGIWTKMSEQTTTEASKSYSFTLYQAGVYHVCMVNKAGYEFMPVAWGGTPYNVNTPNSSGATDESSACTTTVYDDSKDHSDVKRFAALDKMPPSSPVITAIIADGGKDVTNAYTNKKQVTLNWSVVDKAVYYEYGYWNDIPGNPYKESTPWIPSMLGADRLSQAGSFTEGEGKHYLAVRSVAYNGLKSDWSVVSVTYDESDPVVKFLPRSTPQTNLFTDVDVTDVNLTKVAFTVRTPDNTEINVVYSENASNPLSLRDYDLCANDRLKACTDNKLKDGVYTVRAATYDKAGNRNISTSSTIVVDRTAPQISIVLPEDKAILDGSVDIVGNTTDANPSSSKLTVLNAQGEVVISSDDTTGKTQQKLSWDTLKVPDGKYVIKFDATDSAGNTASTVIDVTVANSQNNVVGGLINNPVAPTAPAGSVGGQQGSQSRTAQPTPRYVALGGDTTPVDETITTQETSSPTSVLGQSTTNNGVMSAFNSEDILGTKSCSTILGLCWYWWIPITIAAIATIWFLAYLSQRREEESFGSF